MRMMDTGQDNPLVSDWLFLTVSGVFLPMAVGAVGGARGAVFLHRLSHLSGHGDSLIQHVK